MYLYDLNIYVGVMYIHACVKLYASYICVHTCVVMCAYMCSYVCIHV